MIDNRLSILLWDRSIIILTFRNTTFCEGKVKLYSKSYSSSTSRVLLYTYKFTQDASARRMLRYAHGNKSGAY